MTNKDIYNKLMNAIKNPYGVCGLMASIRAESGMKSTNMQNSYEAKLGMNDASYTQAVDNGIYSNFASDRVGYGFCQWTSPDRKAALLAFAKQRGVSIGNEEMQIDFVIYELSNSYKNVLKTLQSATSVREASDVVITKYERPADQSEAVLVKRAAYGQEFFNELVQENSNEGKEQVNIMRINVHAGHNPDGKVACGAIGFIKESTENRNIKNEVVRLLKALGHTVYDCTYDNGTSEKNVLANNVALCNAHDVDLDVAIHLNAVVGDLPEDGKTTGTEIYVYKETSDAKPYAERTCKAIAELGFKNRGVKTANFYVLRNTKAPAMLIEGCFVDDKDDVALYDYKSMAEAIVYGITGQRYEEPVNDKTDDDINLKDEEVSGDKNALYRVQVGAYSVKTNAEAMKKKLEAAGFDAIVVKQ